MRILTNVKRRHWGDSWYAVDYDTHYYSDDPKGQGRTEQEAIEDLKEQLAELEERIIAAEACSGLDAATYPRLVA